MKPDGYSIDSDVNMQNLISRFKENGRASIKLIWSSFSNRKKRKIRRMERIAEGFQNRNEQLDELKEYQKDTSTYVK